jgi:hypothetical protein
MTHQAISDRMSKTNRGDAAFVAGMERILPCLLACALTLVLAAPASAEVPNPLTSGSHSVERLEYDAGNTIVSDPQGISYPNPLKGSLHVPDGAGPFPVALFLHGRHSTCRVASAEGVGSPCPSTPATGSVPSYAGYDYMAARLASHGYLVISIDANGINTYDAAGDKGGNERAQLIVRSLDLLRAWNAGAGPEPVGARLVGRVDLGRIGLMGHSRGGGGVTNFVAYNRGRTDGPSYPGLRAVFDLAGTDYNTPTVSGVTLGELAPLCDGDVYDLQSLFTWDRSRFADPRERGARVAFVSEGTNHNYFNTVWTSDDYGAGTDTACAPSSPTSNRLSPEAQRRVGEVLMSGFLRRYVGPEPAFDPLMTGASTIPGVTVGYLGPAASRRMLVTPNADATALTQTADGGALSARGFAAYAFCDPKADTGADGGNRDPGRGLMDTCPTHPNRSRARQLTLAWGGPATLRAELGTEGGDVSAFRSLTFRAAVNYTDARNPTASGQDFDVVLVDRDGREATSAAAAHTRALLPPAGSSDRELVPQGVRLPLSEFSGVDLTRLAAVELRFGARTPTGSIQLLELAFQERTVPVTDRAAPGTGPATVAVGGSASASGAAAGAGACRDRVVPQATFSARGATLTRAGLWLRGHAVDRGCGASGVRRVLVAVARLVPGGCRFLMPSGRLDHAVSCARPRWLRATGASAWRLRRSIRLAPGRYLVLARAQDAAGNWQPRPAVARLAVRPRGTS